MQGERPGGEKTVYILAGIFAFLFIAGYFFRHTLSAFLTSLAFAYLLNPPLKYLERRFGNRATAIALLYSGGSILLLLLLFLLVPYVGRQSELLAREMPRYAQNVKTSLGAWQVKLAPYYSGTEGEWLLSRADEILNTLTERVSSLGIERIKGALYGLFNLVLAPILVFFMLYYRDLFKTVAKRLIPAGERDFLLDLGDRINRSLERFVIAMMIDCLIVGILCVVALWLLGIQFSILNGILAGAASIVPVIGGVVAVIPAAFLGYAQSGDPAIIPKVCAAYFLIYVIIEGNLVKPIIMKTTLKLNPLAVIFSLMAMGELLGFWGVVLAVPLAAVVKLCAVEIHHFYLENREP
jgi:predicted PurR-regulated permease PerM